jgi:hypothetical protein
MSDQAAVSEPKAPPTAAEVERQWRGYGVLNVMHRNPAVDSYVREKEAEVHRLWQLISGIASQTDPSWGRELARRAIAEREL